MEFDEVTLKYMDIFQPGLPEKFEAIQKSNKRFVYYTTAETAMKLLRNKELWFRNASVMNDYSEISYGLGLIETVLSGPEGERFREAVDGIFPDTMMRAEQLLSKWKEDWRFETYIACVSVHRPKENERGRLSMWRAYGDTAIVVNNEPMMQVTDAAAVYTLPVLYLSVKKFTEHLSIITDAILINRKYLQDLGQATLLDYIHDMLFQFAIASKHPGFSEEKEWRIYYRPTQMKSPVMNEEIVVRGGVPQKVYKLQLEHDPKKGLHGADIPSLLNKIIIGPTSFPYVSY